ncbi:squalene-hopene cyclase [Gordoniibacillus kamchatkensis]|uniref:Squalene-hopene cyclase n=1 Tax=Gordoniibacillus kamchatkensis TaxID=1590651 RepID=A0ABR5AI10_9BACL|nr:DinB family protein [Paenibacillus sp. VKM B-2647]KIL40679.1 squalene-hopene cyclase [Paenibacillus sp. VKM B-2647]
MKLHVPKPQTGDYFAYFETYISLVPEGQDLLAAYAEQEADVAAYFRELTEGQAAHRYAEGKWSLKELLGHVSDTERVMSYRLLRVSRGDTTPLPGFDENLFVSGASFDSRPIGELLDEFQAVRRATIALLRGLTAEQLQRAGNVNGGRTTAAALAYIVLGHAKHHMNIVRERYAPGIQG